MVRRIKKEAGMSPINYKSAGVDIDAGDETIEKIKDKVETTFTPGVLTGIGSFGAMVDLKELLSDFRHPILVQSIDGVGTKMIVARKMNKYDTIGIDLLSATCNDIVVHGARPLTFLDYIANDRLNPEVINQIVSGIVDACRDVGVPLVGGETAEMPDTYLPGEHDLVGVITGVVEKDKMITGEKIRPGDRVLGFGSSGLHTNGYSLARKLFFEVGQFDVDSLHSHLNKSIGETLLEPHLNYTKPILTLLDAGFPIKGIAHITGGGFVNNIPRILPEGCSVKIRKGSWPVLPVFEVMQELGQLDDYEMFRTFNRGIGLVIFIESKTAEGVKQHIGEEFNFSVYDIGGVVRGKREVLFT